MRSVHTGAAASNAAADQESNVSPSKHAARTTHIPGAQTCCAGIDAKQVVHWPLGVLRGRFAAAETTRTAGSRQIRDKGAGRGGSRCVCGGVTGVPVQPAPAGRCQPALNCSHVLGRTCRQAGRLTAASTPQAGRQAPEAGHERPLQIVAAQQQRCRCSLAVGAAARRLGLQLLRAANKAGSGSVGHENCRASVMLEGRGTHC